MRLTLWLMMPTASLADHAVTNGTFAAKGLSDIKKNAETEMIMSTTSNATLRRDFFPATLSMTLAGILRRWWVAYMNWRLDELAIGQLQSMSDRELKDMGVSRAQIELAVRGDGSNPTFSRYY